MMLLNRKQETETSMASHNSRNISHNQKRKLLGLPELGSRKGSGKGCKAEGKGSGLVPGTKQKAKAQAKQAKQTEQATVQTKTQAKGEQRKANTHQRLEKYLAKNEKQDALVFSNADKAAQRERQKSKKATSK